MDRMKMRAGRSTCCRPLPERPFAPAELYAEAQDDTIGIGEVGRNLRHVMDFWIRHTCMPQRIHIHPL